MPGYIPGAPTGGSSGGSDDSGEINTGGDPGGDAYQADDDDDDEPDYTTVSSGGGGSDDDDSDEINVGDTPAENYQADSGSDSGGSSGSSGDDDREINTGDPPASVYQDDGTTPQGLEAGQSAFSDQARELEQQAIDRFGGSEEDYVVSAQDDRLSVSRTEEAQAERLDARRESVQRIPGAPGGDTFAQDRDDAEFRPTIFGGQSRGSDGPERVPAQTFGGSPFRSERADALSASQAQQQQQQQSGEQFGFDDLTSLPAAAPVAIGSVLSDPVGAVGDFQQFQRETTPVRDFAAGARGLIGAPAPGAETADRFTEAPDRFTFGASSPGSLSPERREEASDLVMGIRESRLEARSAILEGVGDFTSSDAGRAALVAGALAEPTPVGEALLFGGAAAGAAGGAAASDTTEGDSLVPSSPLTNQPELQVPEDGDFQGADRIGVPEDGSPVTDSELGIPDVGGINRPELQPSESPEFGSAEIPIPDRGVGDLLTVSTAQLFREGRQRQRERDRGADQDELDEILSGGGVLGEVDQTPEIDYRDDVTEGPSLDYRGENFGLRDPPRVEESESLIEQPSLDVSQTPELGVAQTPSATSDLGFGASEEPFGLSGSEANQMPELGLGSLTTSTPAVDAVAMPELSVGLTSTAATATTPSFDFPTPTETVEQREPAEYGFGLGSGSSRRRPRFDFGLDAEDTEDVFSFGGEETQQTFGVADLGFGSDDDGGDFSSGWF